MRTVNKIVDDLGGAAAVSSLLGVAYTTVASWKSRKAIPVFYWAKLIEASNGKISSDDLIELNAALGPKKSKSAA